MLSAYSLSISVSVPRNVHALALKCQNIPQKSQVRNCFSQNKKRFRKKIAVSLSRTVYDYRCPSLDAIHILFQIFWKIQDVQVYLDLPCVFNVYSVYIQCLFNVHSMSIQCLFNVYSMSFQCLFIVYSIYTQCLEIYQVSQKNVH